MITQEIHWTSLRGLFKQQLPSNLYAWAAKPKAIFKLRELRQKNEVGQKMDLSNETISNLFFEQIKNLSVFGSVEV